MASTDGLQMRPFIQQQRKAFLMPCNSYSTSLNDVCIMSPSLKGSRYAASQRRLKLAVCESELGGLCRSQLQNFLESGHCQIRCCINSRKSRDLVEDVLPLSARSFQCADDLLKELSIKEYAASGGVQNVQRNSCNCKALQPHFWPKLT